MMHLFEIVAENKPGVLARAAGIAGARGENIERIAAMPAVDTNMARIIILIELSPVHAEYVRRKLLKMIHVCSVVVRAAGSSPNEEFHAAVDARTAQVIDRSLWPPMELSRKAPRMSVSITLG
jgi:acetolactate synthase small subunit